MRLSPVLSSWKPRRDILGRRATSIVLVVIIHLLGFLLLVSLAPEIKFSRPEMKNFSLLNLLDVPAPKAAPQAKSAKAKPSKTKPATATAPPPTLPPNMIFMSKQAFAASDVSRIHSTSDEQATAGAPGASGSSGEAGGGPHGETLYNAAWYREPTQAEINFYLPKNLPPVGWAMIMCRTIANYGVDDCRELGESPSGSGLSGALRQAAWQFKVRPPRVGGKSMVGEWVRIVYDFKTGVVKQ